MGQILNLARSAYRDFVTNGSPSSGFHKPAKRDIISVFEEVEAQIVDVTESIVDFSAGVSWHDPVACATTGNITLSGEQTVDNVSATAGTRVLVKNQSAPEQNGVYVAASGAWSRATDMDAGSEFVAAGVLVVSGTANGNTQWVCTTPGPITVGTTAISFVKVKEDDAATASEVQAARGDLNSLGARLDMIDRARIRERANRKRVLPRVLWLGDSQFNQGINNNDDGDFMNSTAYSEQSVAFQLFPVFDNDTWHDAINNSVTWMAGANQGRSSYTARQAADAAVNWFAGSGGYRVRPFDVLIVNLGINDIWLEDRTVSAIVDDLRTIIEIARGKGAHVIVGCPRPVAYTVAADSTTWANGSAKRLKLIDLRDEIILLVAEFSEEVRFWDTWAALGDAGGDVMEADYTYDGLHINVLGAHVSALALINSHLRQILPNVSSEPDWELENVFTEGFTGTGGTRGTRVTSGDVPDDFAVAWVAGDANLYATSAVTEASDGSNQVQLYCAPSGATGTGRLSFYQYDIPVPDWIEGRWVRGFLEVETTTWDAWRGIALKIEARDAEGSKNAADGIEYNDGIVYTDDPDVLPTTAFRKLLMTPPFIMPADRTSLSFIVDILVDGSKGGAGTVTLRRPFYGLVEDPRPYWGFA